MTIGEACRIRIQQLCSERGITLNKLAITSGITQSTLNNIMSGRNKSTTVSTIKKICDGIDISVLDFFSSDIFADLEQEIK
ncbi:MAG: helix-turn-helix transcriptional regulator [Clostridia bacterium]|nr:helix-turn-helix transcriptional regulator [Clostridia bacterium]